MTTTSLAAKAIPRRAGRPRSETTRRKILEATVHLLEDVTVQSLTIEAIAREAGVGKATIYRWWDSKALVVIDAFIEHHIVRTPMPRDLPPAEALAIHFQHSCGSTPDGLAISSPRSSRKDRPIRPCSESSGNASTTAGEPWSAKSWNSGVATAASQRRATSKCSVT